MHTLFRQLLTSSEHVTYDEGTIHLKNCQMTNWNTDELEYIYESNVIFEPCVELEQTTYEKIEINSNKFEESGVYVDINHFIDTIYLKEVDNVDIYIHEPILFPMEELKTRINGIVYFIKALRDVAEFEPPISDMENTTKLFFVGEKSCLLDVEITVQALNSFSSDCATNAKEIAQVLNNKDNARWQIFFNELIDEFINEKCLEGILIKINAIKNKCDTAYAYYMSNYKYSKLKIEVDTKLMEYSSKIQNVLTDTKLIIIPSAFLLILPQVNHKEFVVKNIVLLCVSIISACITNIHLGTQKDTLNLLQNKTKEYEKQLNKNNSNILGKFLEISFSNLKSAINKQSTRLIWLYVANWILPTAICILLIISAIKDFSTTYHVISSIIERILCTIYQIHQLTT